MKLFGSKDNLELGTATMAYISHNFGENQIGEDYEVIDDPNGLQLFWNREETEPTDEQLEAALNTWDWDNVRKERNDLLAVTDFYANTDVTMSDEMKTYRQDLRDIPASTADSEDVVWPTKP